MKAGKKVSVSSRIIGVIIFCWFLPILLTMGVAGYYMFSHHFRGTLEEELTQISFDQKICTERLNNTIISSKKASYEGDIERAYQRYQKGEISEKEMTVISQKYISGKYAHDVGIREAVFWFYDNPETMRNYVYNQNVGGTYAAINGYWKEDHEAVYGCAEKLGTGIGFYEKDGRVYLIRNLLSRTYKPIGALIFRLNPEHYFGSLMRKPLESSVNICLGDCLFVLQGEELPVSELKFKEPSIGETYEYQWKGRQLYLYGSSVENTYRVQTYIRYNETGALIPLFGYQIVVACMFVLLVPLLYFCIRMLKKYISEPIDTMVRAAEEIEKGNFGYQMEEEAQSREFGYLKDTFNHMSAKLKEQFNRIYEEEVALRDAKIMALQSHINPHFMNNTLEIINWEARMNGCGKVSKMIESLSVLLDASIDRKKQPEVTLKEEMRYVNAYLYIISERFGNRVCVVNDFPEGIMEYHVPRLILQPVIENAIEHGVAKKRNGTVELLARENGDFLYIDIINDQVEKLDEEKIKQLLDINYNTSKEPSGNMGIANVNQRLHILYGEPCGLQIFAADGEKTCARLTIRKKQI